MTGENDILKTYANGTTYVKWKQANKKYKNSMYTKHQFCLCIYKYTHIRRK